MRTNNISYLSDYKTIENRMSPQIDFLYNCNYFLKQTTLLVRKKYDYLVTNFEIIEADALFLINH